MKRFYSIIAIVTMLLCGYGTASAQDSTNVNSATTELQPTALADSIKVLNQKVTKLEKKYKDLLKVEGFIQAMYSWQQGETSEDNVNHFRIRRARLVLKGQLYKKLIDYNFTTDFAGGVKIVDAYMRFTPWKQFNVQVGAFRPSFTIENMFYGSLSMEGIDYPQVVKKMTHLGDITGLNSAGRDIGIQVHGGFFNKRGFSTLEYRIGVFNGNGVMVTKDDNKAKDYSAMLGVYPIKNLVFVGSCYFGKWNNGVTAENARTRWSVGYRYDDGKIFTRGEYIRGMTQGLSRTGVSDDKTYSEGAYVMLGARFFKQKFAPFARVEYFAQDRYAHKSCGEPYYSVGIDYNPIKYIRLQALYTCKTFNNGSHARSVMELLLTAKF